MNHPVWMGVEFLELELDDDGRREGTLEEILEPCGAASSIPLDKGEDRDFINWTWAALSDALLLPLQTPKTQQL